MGLVGDGLQGSEYGSGMSVGSAEIVVVLIFAGLIWLAIWVALRYFHGRD